MDMGDPPQRHSSDAGENEDSHSDHEQLKSLPVDLPTSLDDRRRAPEYAGETEIYDGWQGELGLHPTCIICPLVDADLFPPRKLRTIPVPRDADNHKTTIV